MARTNAVNYTGVNQFPRADAATDLFKKEDVQVLALAVDNHDHSSGKGLPLPAGAIPNGTITSAMIADGTIVAADIQDGAITSAKILDGTIATADHADASVTNAKLGTDTARLNLLTNGGFEIWQRGNGPFTAHTAYTADRWFILLGSGGSALSVSRDAANIPSGGRYAAALTHTLGGSAALYMQNAEVGKAAFSRTYSFSIMVLAAAANAIRPWIANGASGKVYGAYHTGNNTFQTLTASSAISGGFPGPNLDMGVELAASGTFYVSNAMLVMGSVAADYAPLHPADDLARCLRYYEGHFGTGYPTILGVATAASQNIGYGVGFAAQKAVVPTITKVGTWVATNCGQPSAGSASGSGYQLYVASSGAGQVQSQPNSPSNGVTAESNP